MKVQQALDKLMQGHQKFLSALKSGQTLPQKIKARSLSNPQKPFAVILSCADSRVPSEHIFGQAFGDLFVVRVAGNIATPTQIGSIEFACQNFGSRLIVVLGHTHCGAVAATVDALLTPDTSPDISSNLASIVTDVRSGVEDVVNQFRNEQKEELLARCGKANILNAVKNLRERSSVLSGLEDSGDIKIVGAEFDLESGSLSILN